MIGESLYPRKNRAGFPFIGLTASISLLVAAGILFTELVRFSEYRRENQQVQAVVGGVEVTTLEDEALQEELEEVFIEQPVLLRYNESPFYLYPREVSFTLDIPTMQAAVRTSSGGDFWGEFWDFLLDRPVDDARRSDRIAVELVANDDDLPREIREYLEYEVIPRYDQTSSQPVFDPAALTFPDSTGEVRLDINAAIPLIQAALYQPDMANRVVNLPTTTTGGEVPDMIVLRQSIQQYLQSQNVNVDTSQSIMSVFVMDLETGQEMGINERVHHSATSTIKIGILANYFREKVQKPPDDVQLVMASMVVCSENSAANTLLELTNDEGDNLEGLRKTNDTLCEAGAVNSFITSKLDVGPQGQGNVAVGYYTEIPRPRCQEANMQNSSLDSTVSVPTADFYLRSTAADMGTLLMNTYECAQHGTGLATIFPDEITQTECRWMLELLEGTRFFRLGELGLPEDRDVAYYAHKVGYGGEAVADAGIVFSPGGDYVLVMYLWDARLDEFGQTLQQRWDVLAEVSRIVYNYFNPEAPVTQPRTPPNPLGGEGCVLPRTVGEINLDDIDENRFDEDGNPLPSACYDWPSCVPFNGWGNNN